ncbi:MAG: hypothetical protein KDD35_07640, partial [Bdellovibrionales bacterium]|nr:hypothetical protein [Bdellovibrionales bacterium]
NSQLWGPMSEEDKKDNLGSGELRAEESPSGDRGQVDRQREVLREYGISDISELDKLEISLLIIAKSKNQLESAGSFLSRRGWSTAITSSMAEAINLLVSRKPKFVLVSVNHPNPKIARLPMVLGQAFNTKCIGFAEKSDGVSQGLLNNLKTPLKFFGQLSGPSIHRQIKKLILDEYEQAKEKSSQSYDYGLEGENNNIRISGTGEDGRQTVEASDKDQGNHSFQFGKNAPPDAASLLKMFADEGDESAESQTQKESSSQSNQGRNSKQEPGKSDAGTISQGSLSDSLVYEETGQGHRKKRSIRAESKKGETKPSIFSISPLSAQGSQSGSEYSSNEDGKTSPKAKALSHDEKNVPGGSGQGDVSNLSKANIDQNSGSTRSSAQDGSATELGLESQKENESSSGRDSSGKNKPILLGQEHSKSEVEKEESLALARVVKKAMAEVCSENNSQTQYLLRVKNLGVIPFCSSIRAGYFAVGWAGRTQNENSAFLEALKFSLMNFLAIEGVSASLAPEFFMAIPDINYLEWTKNAEFLVVREHQGVEVGVSFLEGRQESKLASVSKDKMVPVALEDISPGKPVNFKAYLKLELNNKYVLYLTEGRSISQNQKDRLQSKSVKHFHIGHEDAERYRRYLNELEILSRINAFAFPSKNKKTG